MSRHAHLERDDPELTLSAWAHLPEDEPGELVDGRLEEEEVPDYVHEFLVFLLSRILGNWLVPRGGVAGGSGAKFAIGERRGRKPDLSVFLPGTPPPPRRGLVSRPPDIAIEIVSPTPRDHRRDWVEKVHEYAAFGIRWYWIIDPEARSFHVLELGEDGRYAHAVDATEGTVREVPGCEGLEIDLDALWTTVDELTRAGAGEADDEPAVPTD